MSDPQPTPDTDDKPGMSVPQPATVPVPATLARTPRQTASQGDAQQGESSSEGNPDVIVKPGMSVGG
jgi:hypothetical protein